MHSSQSLQVFSEPDLSFLELGLPHADSADASAEASRLLHHLLITGQLLGGLCEPSAQLLQLLWQGLTMSAAPEPYYVQLLRYYTHETGEWADSVATPVAPISHNLRAAGC